MRLVLAGGYDVRVRENVEHLKELQQLVSRWDKRRMGVMLGAWDKAVTVTCEIVMLCSMCVRHTW